MCVHFYTLHTHTHTHTHTHCKSACVCVCVCVCVCAYVSMCVHFYMHVCIHMYEYNAKLMFSCIFHSKKRIYFRFLPSQVVMISDVFSTSGQFDWMLVTFLEQLNISSHDDVITYSALIYGLLKSSAVGRIVSVIYVPITCLTRCMYVCVHVCHVICLDTVV